MNQLHGSPLASRKFCWIKNTLLMHLPHHTNINLRGKEINTNEVSTEEIIHWYFHPLPTQALIDPQNKNKTLKIVPLWVISVVEVIKL